MRDVDGIAHGFSLPEQMPRGPAGDRELAGQRREMLDGSRSMISVIIAVAFTVSPITSRSCAGFSVR